MESLIFNITFYSYLIAALLITLIGALYAFRKQVMPYHLEVLESTWVEVEPKYQFMLLKLLNGGGFYGISSGLFMLTILWIPFRNGQDWAGFAIGAIGIIGILPLANIVYQVKTKTKAHPPLRLVIILNLLLIIGLLSHTIPFIL